MLNTCDPTAQHKKSYKDSSIVVSQVSHPVRSTQTCKARARMRKRGSSLNKHPALLPQKGDLRDVAAGESWDHNDDSRPQLERSGSSLRSERMQQLSCKPPAVDGRQG